MSSTDVSPGATLEERSPPYVVLAHSLRLEREALALALRSYRPWVRVLTIDPESAGTLEITEAPLLVVFDQCLEHLWSEISATIWINRENPATGTIQVGSERNTGVKISLKTIIDTLDESVRLRSST